MKFTRTRGFFNQHIINAPLYTCIYRWDITFEAKERSLSSLVENAKEKRLGVSFEPLFKLEMTNIVIDELHMFLRIMDILLRNLLWEMIYQDEVQAFHKQKSSYLENTVQSIRGCGLSFQVKLMYMHVYTITF